MKTANLKITFTFADFHFPYRLPNLMPSEPSDGIRCLFFGLNRYGFVLRRLVPVIQHAEFDGDSAL